MAAKAIDAIAVDSWEEQALLRMIGASFQRAEMIRNRVVLTFEVTEKHLHALTEFRAGKGPRCSNISRFAEALRWSKDQTWATRRSAGVT